MNGIKEKLARHAYYLSFTLSLVTFILGVYGVKNEKITLCARGPVCTEYSLNDYSGEYWIVIGLFFIVSILLIVHGVYLIKIKNEKKPKNVEHDKKSRY